LAQVSVATNSIVGACGDLGNIAIIVVVEVGCTWRRTVCTAVLIVPILIIRKVVWIVWVVAVRIPETRSTCDRCSASCRAYASRRLSAVEILRVRYEFLLRDRSYVWTQDSVPCKRQAQNSNENQSNEAGRPESIPTRLNGLICLAHCSNHLYDDSS